MITVGVPYGSLLVLASFVVVGWRWHLLNLEYLCPNCNNPHDFLALLEYQRNQDNGE